MVPKDYMYKTTTFEPCHEPLLCFSLSRDNQLVVTSSLMDSASLDQIANSTTRCCHTRAWPCLHLFLLIMLHLFHQPIRGSHHRQAALFQSLCLMVNLMRRRKAQRPRNQTMILNSWKCRILLRIRHHHDHDSWSHQLNLLSEACKDLNDLSLCPFLLIFVEEEGRWMCFSFVLAHGWKEQYRTKPVMQFSPVCDSVNKVYIELIEFVSLTSSSSLLWNCYYKRHF